MFHLMEPDISIHQVPLIDKILYVDNGVLAQFKKHSTNSRIAKSIHALSKDAKLLEMLQRMGYLTSIVNWKCSCLPNHHPNHQTWTYLILTATLAKLLMQVLPLLAQIRPLLLSLNG